MEVIDLSNNNLSGELPNCWHKSSNLYIMDFSRNNFWGEIPSNIGSLSSLLTLHLSWNNLSGMLPTSLQSCNRLLFIDLAENSLSGNIPKWIGGLQALVLLSLGSNQFSGEIPEELSQLHALQYLDFSNNKLSGPVTLFLGNLTALHMGIPVWDDAPPFIEFMVYGVGGAYFSVYTDTLEATFKGRMLTFRICYLLRSIDLSANQLTGDIPSEIGFLSALSGLNLSMNYIGGSIPDEIGRMPNLESLDLSWNYLSGSIPQSFASLVSLGYMNLSYNDLSGKIPSGNQLDTFDGDSYLGNVNLCGAILSRICLPDSSKHRHHKLHQHFDTVTFLCMLLGFASGFSTVLVILISSAAARKAYFEFTDNMLNKLHTEDRMKLHSNRALAGRNLSMPTESQNSLTCYHFEGSPFPLVEKHSII
jgi:Leucine-rich repeat (LRR) protein